MTWSAYRRLGRRGTQRWSEILAVPPPEVGKRVRREVTLFFDRQRRVTGVRSLRRGENENYHVGMSAADPKRRIDAVQVRHLHVEQYQLRLELPDEVECLAS